MKSNTKATARGTAAAARPGWLPRLWQMLALAMALCLPGLAQAALTITRVSAPVLYIDTGANLRAAYVAYQVTSSTAENDLWVGIGSFSGTGSVVSLAPNEDGVQQLGPFTAGQTKTAYFYIQASGTTASAQSHTVSVYGARPPGAALASSTFTLTVESTIEAQANKVTAVVSGPTPAGTLGGIVTITVTGDTGTTGGSGTLAFTPAAYTSWRADVYELYDVEISLPGGTTLSDRLYTVGFSDSGPYTAIYRFKATGTTATPTAVSPVGYISSGNPIKHTGTGGFASLPAVPAPVNALTLTKLVNPTLPSGGDTLTYTIRVTNGSSNDASLERIVDSLPATPAAVSYTGGSSTWGGAAVPDPAVSGSTLTWSGVFTVPANSSRDLVFQAVLPSAPGAYVNSAIGYIGTTVIDTTLSTSDNSPATATVTIGPDLTLTKTHTGNFTQGQSGSYTLTVSNTGNAATSGTVTMTDTLPAGMTPSSASGTGWTCGIAGQTVTCTRSDALAGGASYPAITLAVNVALTAATPLVNTAGVSGGGDANSGNNSASDSTTINAAPADMSVAISGLAATAAPGGSLTGSLVCTNAGPGQALSATCSATVSAGASISIGSCTASSGTAAALPSGATLTCPITVTAPGTAGGTDTAATGVTVSASTGASNDSAAGNNSASASAELIDALSDSASLPAGGGNVGLLANDTLGSAAAGVSNVTASITADGGLTGVSIDASGNLVVPGGAPSGSYTVTYRICAVAAPAVCDSASVAVTKATPADMAVAISGLPAVAAPGSTVTATVTCSNSGGSAATNASCSVSGLPAGASVSCTPTSPQATLAAAASISCAVSYTAPTTGSVTLAAATAADSDANAGNNSASTGTAVIDAVNDSANLSASGGSIALLGNDSLGGSAATSGSVTTTLSNAGGLAGLSIDASGNLVVPGSAAAGSYTVAYRICAIAAPAVCDDATVAVTKAASPDMGVVISGLPAFAAPGSNVSATVTCTNHGGSAATNASCAASGLPAGASVVCTPNSPQASLAAGASISCAVSYVAPANGSVTLAATTGSTGDANSADNSASASTAVVDAVADSASISPATGGSLPLLTNDRIGGSTATPGIASATLLSGGGLAGASIDASGQLQVPAGTAAGTYSVSYRLCAVAAPSVCDDAVATVTVVSLAPADMAVTINGLPALAAPGSTVTATLTCSNGGGNAASNAMCSASGLPAGASVICTPTSPQASLAAGASISCAVSFTAPATGSVTLTATTAADTDANPANNSASASVALIDAVADGGSLSTAGGSIALLGNDSLGANPATISLVSASLTDNGGLTGASIDAAGQLVVPAGTPAGNYLLTYRICAIAAPAVCDSATVTLGVTTPADMAVTNSGFPGSTAPGASVTGTVTCTNVGGSAALNASCAVSGLPAGASVVCTPPSPQASLAPGASISCAVSYTAPASGSVVLVATTGASNDSNNTNASTTQTALVLDAVDDSASVAGTGARVPLLANDTLGASAATPTLATIAVQGSWPAGLSLDSATGELVVAAGTPDGSYSLGYRLCAVASPGTCDTATVSLTIASSNMGAVYSGLPASVQPGDTVQATLTCSNTGNAAATNASCTPSGLPAGASVSCTPPSPQATLAPGSAIVCTIRFTAPANAGTLTLGAIGTASNDATPSNDSTSAALTINDFRLDVVKSAGAPAYVQSGASSFDVSYRISVKAQGANAVPNVQVADSLAHSFAAGSPTITVLSVQVVSGACSANAAYDGRTNTGLLSGSDSLAAGASCTIELRARIAYASPAAVPASDNGNLAYASGLPGAGPNPGHGFGAGGPVAPAGAVGVDISNDSATAPSVPNGDNSAGSPTAMRLPVLATVTGSVFVDGNGNGRQDANEVPKARYLVQVVQPADPANPAAASTLLPYLQAVTAADGSYVLPGVPAGTALALRFLPLAEGSGLTPETAVAAVPAGVTAAPVLGGTPVNGAPGVNTATTLPTRAYLPLQIDPAAIAAGATVPNQSLPIDPSGVVYDSVTREPVAGATVQLQTASGAPVPAGTLLAGTSNTIVTNADGVYAFLLEGSAIPGTYRLAVTPPASHAVSTSILPQPALNVPVGAGAYLVQAQSGAPTGTQPTNFHLEFVFTQPRDVVHNHIPLDPRGGAALFIDKQADRRQAEIGDSVLYRIRLRNPNAFAVPAVQIEDRLPLGFTLITGSTRLSVGNASTAVAEPAGAPGPVMNFAVGTLAANAEAVLSYRVRIGIGADRGTGTNSARASGTGGALASRTAQATVKVGGGVFSREACVIGKVYLDCNGNAQQDSGEPGIPGVRLVFEDGTALTTDTNGQVSLCGLRAITHVLKVDTHSLPIGSLLGITGSRNAGDAGSRFVDLKAGELHRADFRVTSCTPALQQQVEQRRANGHAPPDRGRSPTPNGVRFDSATQPQPAHTTGGTK